jgi:hypothetical protein
MATAMVITATNVKPGVLSRERRAYRMEEQVNEFVRGTV